MTTYQCPSYEAKASINNVKDIRDLQIGLGLRACGQFTIPFIPFFIHQLLAIVGVIATLVRSPEQPYNLQFFLSLNLDYPYESPNVQLILVYLSSP
jgi:hypothetical protein